MRRGRRINFTANALTIQNNLTVPLVPTSGGAFHLHGNRYWCVPFGGIKFQMRATSDTADGFPDQQIRQLHLQLGHAATELNRRVIKRDGECAEKERIINAVRRCLCGRMEIPRRNPIVNIHLIKCPWQVIFGDIFFPVGCKIKPAVMWVFSVYCCSVFKEFFRRCGDYHFD